MAIINTHSILCILQLPPPVHGVSMMNNYFINSELIRSKYNLEVVNLQFAKSLKELRKFSILKVFKAIGYGIEIVQKVLITNPDLIYFTFSPKGYAFYRDAFYVFLLKSMNRNIVFHLHGKGIKENSNNSFFKKYLYKWVFKNTHVICLSKYLVTDIEDIYKSTPYIVPNGIQEQQRNNHIISQSKGTVPQILYLSKLSREKGVLVLVEALKILHNKGFRFNARLVGAPADLTIKNLENIISENKLSGSVQVIGPLYNEEKYLEFQKADLFVLPTLFEAFGLVNLEAMQFSLPVISTYEGGIPEIVIDKETGFLVETQNAEMLADKIGILLKDKDLRMAMGKKGYARFISNYSLKHFERNINKTFQAILVMHKSCKF